MDVPENLPRLDPISSLFRASWQIYKDRFWDIAGIVVLPLMLIFIGGMFLNLNGGGFVLGLIISLCACVLVLVASSAIIFAVHEKSGVWESYKKALALLWPIVWLGILILFVVMGGFVVFIIPGILFSIWIAFSTYALLLEGKRGMNAMVQSRGYVEGYWWAILGRFVLLMLFTILVGVAIQIPVAILVGNVAHSVATALLDVLFQSFAIVYSYVLYQNLRAAKPNLTSAQANKGKGLFIGSGIVGLIAPILISIIIIFFSAPLSTALISGQGSVSTLNYTHIVVSGPRETDAALIQQLDNDLSDQSIWDGQTTFLGSATSSLGSVSVVLPPLYSQNNYIFSEVIPKSSDPVLLIEALSATNNLDDAVAYVKKLLTSYVNAGNSIEVTTTTFAGYPARAISITNQDNLKFTAFQADRSVFLIGITYATTLIPNAPNSAPDVLSAENQVMDKVVSSITMVYQNSQYGYAIRLPAGIEYVGGSTMCSDCAYFKESGMTDDEMASSGAQFTMSVYQVSLATYISSKQKVYTALKRSFMESTTTVAGNNAMQFEDEMVYSGGAGCPIMNSGDFVPCRSIGTVWSHGANLYDFDITVFGTGDFNKYNSIYDEMLSGFSFR
ncbi:MAG: hypothetical protein ABSE18_00610 [Minisyncoccia bacterium]|jgi:hypothetical protein